MCGKVVKNVSRDYFDSGLQSEKKEVEVVTSQKVEFNESEVIINWLIVHHLVRELINNVNLKE